MASFSAGTRHGQILEDIRAKIITGEWEPGFQLDKETDMAVRYGVSRMTMNKVLTQLAQDGFVLRRKRGGTFVAKTRAQSAVLEISSIKDEVAALGKRHGWRLTNSETRVLDSGDLKLLGVRRDTLPETARVLTGVHLADDAPFCLETRAISLSIVPDAATFDFSQTVPGGWLLQTMPWTSARHSIRAINAMGRDARDLNVAVGTACLEILRKTEIGGQWVTFARLLYSGEDHQLTAEFEPRSVG